MAIDDPIIKEAQLCISLIHQTAIPRRLYLERGKIVRIYDEQIWRAIRDYEQVIEERRRQLNAVKKT